MLVFSRTSTVISRLHGRFLSPQFDAIFVALKLQLKNRTCKPGAIFNPICLRDVAGVSNMFETWCNFSVAKIAWGCRAKNRMCKRALRYHFYCIKLVYNSLPFHLMSKKFNIRLKMLITTKMFTYPFTRDLNLTNPRRRTLKKLFVNSDPRCSLNLPRKIYQIFPLRRCNVSIETFWY